MPSLLFPLRHPQLLPHMPGIWQGRRSLCHQSVCCNICASFSEEQQIKIKHRRRYVRKQKAWDPCNTNKEDDLDLLGDCVAAFSGTRADLEGAAENLFTLPPCPQPLRFKSLSLKTPQTATPGTALQNKIGSRLEKSLGAQFYIQLQQQMEVFQASMLEAMKSLGDKMHSMKKASGVGCSSDVRLFTKSWTQ